LSFSSPISLLELGEKKKLRELTALIISRVLEEYDFHLKLIEDSAPGIAA